MNLALAEILGLISIITRLVISPTSPHITLCGTSGYRLYTLYQFVLDSWWQDNKYGLCYHFYMLQQKSHVPWFQNTHKTNRAETKNTSIVSKNRFQSHYAWGGKMTKITTWQTSAASYITLTASMKARHKQHKQNACC